MITAIIPRQHCAIMPKHGYQKLELAYLRSIIPFRHPPIDLASIPAEIVLQYPHQRLFSMFLYSPQTCEMNANLN